MKRSSVCVFVGFVFAASAAWAETQYVTDQLSVPLHPEPASNAPIVKTLTTGTALEVLEQIGGFAHVRDPQGTEGWIEGAVLSPRPPSAAQVKSLRAEIERTRALLAQTQAQVDKNRDARTSVPATQADAELAALRAQLTEAQGEIRKKDAQLAQLKDGSAETPAAGAAGPPPGEGGFSFLWLGLGFAMLIVGFVGGVVWVRESIRRRMGGMYLRI
jgi:SH3 domain protein